MDGTAWTAAGTIAAIVLGVWGAGLSTYNTLQSWRDKRPRVRVRVSYGVLPTRTAPRIAVVIGVSNPGQQPVTITEVGIELPDKRHLIMPRLEGTRPLPCNLSIGAGETFFMDPRLVAKRLRDEDISGAIRVRGYCRSAVGRIFFSAHETFDIDARLADA